MFSSAVLKNKGFLLLSVVTVLLTLLVGFLLWSQVHTHSVQTLREQVDQWQPLLASLRWLLIGSVALGWPQLCRWLAWSGSISINKIQHLTAIRWRIVGWLVVIELILGQSVLVKLITILIGKTA